MIESFLWQNIFCPLAPMVLAQQIVVRVFCGFFLFAIHVKEREEDIKKKKGNENWKRKEMKRKEKNKDYFVVFLVFKF